jgi:hypothetical protein
MLSKVPLNWNYVLSDYWADIWELEINEEYLLTTNDDDVMCHDDDDGDDSTDIFARNFPGSSDTNHHSL